MLDFYLAIDKNYYQVENFVFIKILFKYNILYPKSILALWNIDSLVLVHLKPFEVCLQMQNFNSFSLSFHFKKAQSLDSQELQFLTYKTDNTLVK